MPALRRRQEPPNNWRKLRRSRGEVAVTIIRRELRKRLRESSEGAVVGQAVGRLLGDN